MTLLCALPQKQFSHHHYTHYISKHLLSQPEEGWLDPGLLSCTERTCSGQLLNILCLATSSVLFWFCTNGVSKFIVFCGEVLNFHSLFFCNKLHLKFSMSLKLLCTWHCLSWMGALWEGKKTLEPQGIWGSWDTVYEILILVLSIHHNAVQTLISVQTGSSSGEGVTGEEG